MPKYLRLRACTRLFRRIQRYGRPTYATRVVERASPQKARHSATTAIAPATTHAANIGLPSVNLLGSLSTTYSVNRCSV